MRSLSAGELLRVWEQGLAQPPVLRALTLLTAACPDVPSDELARLSIGQRNAHLLTLREWVFGPQLVCLVTCPGCGERLEMALNVADIRTTSPQPSAGQAESSEEVETLSLSVADYEMRFRLPNSLDLIALTGSEDVLATRQLLLERCLLAVRQNGEETSIDQLPADVTTTVVEQMAQADPQADMQLALTCPVCDHQWQAIFDIVSFFWHELNVWAARILREVHLLATSYGWREADILAMSPWRRQFYLEMVNGS